MIVKLGMNVVRKLERCTGLWKKWCARYGISPQDKLEVVVYDKYYNKIGFTLDGGSTHWDVREFLACTDESEPVAPQPPVLPQPKPAPVYDAVKQPKHYALFDEVESIQVIASSMTKEEFRGFCFGNRLKYRMRAGKKDNVEQELNKSDFYIELFNKHKDLCRTSSLFGA